MRLLLRDLTPNTRYAVQVRSVAGNQVSSWSFIRQFTTIQDNVKPKTPTGFAFAFQGASLNASWIAVTQDVDGQAIQDFSHYELALRAVPAFSNHEIKTINTTVSLSVEDLKQMLGDPLSTHYYGKVRAVDTGGNFSDWTAEILAQAVAPEPPTNAVVVEGIDSVSISWDRSVSEDVVSYRVYGSTDPAFTPSGDNRLFDGDATNFVHHTATYQLHYYKIRAYSILNLESADLLAMGTPKSPFEADVTPPAVPGGLAAAIVRSTAGTIETASANLTWTFDDQLPDNEDISHFVIKWRKVGGAYNLQYVAKELRTVNIPLPQPYSNYEFQIASIDKISNYSAYSDVVTLNGALAGAPGALTGVVASSGLDSITLKWNPATEGDVLYGGKYQVEIDTEASFTAPNLLQYDTGNTQITVSGLLQDTLYHYRIRAVDSANTNGAWTAGTVTTSGIPSVEVTDGYAPAQSPTPAVLSSGLGNLYVTWNPVLLNSNGGSQVDTVTYEVHLSTSNGFSPTSGTKAAEVSATFATLKVLPGTSTPLSYGTTYYVRLIAKDADGAAAAGNQGSALLTQIQTGDVAPGVITTDLMLANSINGDRIAANTLTVNKLTSGTISTTTINLGANGVINVDSTGLIQSNNYTPGSTGWRLSSTGLEMNTGSVSAAAITSGTMGAHTFTVGSGGAIRSSNWNGTTTGWNLDSSGLTIYNGTIQGPAVYTNALRSIATDPVTGQYLFNINAGGYASFSGARIYGNTVLGSASSSTHFIQSYNYSQGSVGWKIDASGGAEFNNMIARGYVSTGYYGSTRAYLADSNYTWGNSSIQLYEAGLYMNGINFEMYRHARVALIFNGTNLRIESGQRYSSDSQGYISVGSNGIDYAPGSGSHYFYGNGTMSGSLTANGLSVNGYSISNIGSLYPSSSGMYLYGHLWLGSSAYHIDTNGGSIYAGTITTSGNTINTGGGQLNMNGGSITNVGSGGYYQYGGPMEVDSMGSYSGGSANVNWNSTNGYLRIATSSRKYKENIRLAGQADIDTEKILALQPKVFQRNDERDENGDLLPVEQSPWFIGFIAEEAEDLGLNYWITRDKDGGVMGFAYDVFVVAHQQILREQSDTIKSLESRLKELEKKLAE